MAAVLVACTTGPAPPTSLHVGRRVFVSWIALLSPFGVASHLLSAHAGLEFASLAALLFPSPFSCLPPQTHAPDTTVCRQQPLDYCH